MLSLIQNVQFRNHHNEFQDKLSQDLSKIRADENLLVAADKTTNFYRLDAPIYDKLLDTAMTETYKKAPTKTTDRIISDEKKIAKSLGIDNRVDSLATKD
jgi:hemerythrin superfamily protein